MFDRILNNSMQSAVLKSMDAGMLRNRVISNNIANVTTPGFKRVEVSFEDELKRALDSSKLKGQRTNSGHIAFGRKDISNVEAHAYKPIDPSTPSGMNNVDIDTEMAKLAENQLKYMMDIKFLKSNYSKINAAIAGKQITQ